MNIISFLDTAVINFFESIRTPILTGFFKFVTFWGEWPIVLAVVAIISFIIFRRLKMMPALILWFATIGSAIDAHILKALVHRPRPIISIIENSSFSFPSAHATLAAACYGFIIYLAAMHAKNKRLRKVIIIGGSIAVALIAISRLYLGAHYLSDVVAGLLLGGAWLAICIYIFKIIKK